MKREIIFWYRSWTNAFTNAGIVVRGRECVCLVILLKSTSRYVYLQARQLVGVQRCVRAFVKRMRVKRKQLLSDVLEDIEDVANIIEKYVV